MGAEQTNVLAFHLVADGVSQAAIVHGTAKPEGLSLVEKPILSDRDLVSYDPGDHTFVVTDEAAGRVHEACRRRLQAPFVLLAGKERVYVGIFSSPYSSISSGLPSVTLWFPGTGTNISTNVFQISRGYPDSSDGVAGPDLRADPRVIAAVRRLFPSSKPEK